MSQSAASARPLASTRTVLLVDAEQLLDRLLGLLVGALAEVLVPDASDAVHEVGGRPVAVVERSPDGEVVVDDDRVVDPEVAGGAADVVEVVLEAELGCVDADDDGPAVVVALVPRPQVGQRAQPVHARVRPEVDEDVEPAQSRGGERLRVEPDGRAVERGERTVGCVG